MLSSESLKPDPGTLCGVCQRPIEEGQLFAKAVLSAPGTTTPKGFHHMPCLFDWLAENPGQNLAK